MLLGAKIHVHMNHKNVLFESLQMLCFLRWNSYIEAYSPILHYIEGPKNVIADTFSRLHCKDETSVFKEKNITIDPNISKQPIINCKVSGTTNNENTYYSILDYKELINCFLALPNEECYINLPLKNIDKNPLNLKNIREKQYADD